MAKAMDVIGGPRHLANQTHFPIPIRGATERASRGIANTRFARFRARAQWPLSSWRLRTGPGNPMHPCLLRPLPPTFNLEHLRDRGPRGTSS